MGLESRTRGLHLGLWVMHSDCMPMGVWSRPGAGQEWAQDCLLQLSGVWIVKATVSERNQTALRRPLVEFPFRVSCPQPGTLEVEITVM